MIRNLKALGLALIAMLAMGAMAASAASADFDSTNDGVTVLSGSQGATKHKFTTKAGTVECGEASFPGEAEGTSVETITITPVYGTCHTTILGETHVVHVNLNTCDYTFATGATTEGGTIVDGTVDIDCTTAGDSIDVEITGLESLCTITVPEQTIGGITYHNTGSATGATVDVNANVTTLKYTQHGIFCPGNSFSPTKTFETGTYTGSVEEKGKTEGGSPVGIAAT